MCQEPANTSEKKCGTRGTTDGNDNIHCDATLLQNLVNFDRKRIAHGHSTAVDTDAVKH